VVNGDIVQLHSNRVPSFNKHGFDDRRFHALNMARLAIGFHARIDLNFKWTHWTAQAAAPANPFTKRSNAALASAMTLGRIGGTRQ
jgi:hypothetical protein